MPLTFRFDGQPVLTRTKRRVSVSGGRRWANNVYQLRPITGFAIFEQAESRLASLEQTTARRERFEHDRRRREDEAARTEAERDAYFALPAEERLAINLKRRVAVFKSLEKRDPTPAELEELRRRLHDEQSASA